MLTDGHQELTAAGVSYVGQVWGDPFGLQVLQNLNPRA